MKLSTSFQSDLYLIRKRSKKIKSMRESSKTARMAEKWSKKKKKSKTINSNERWKTPKEGQQEWENDKETAWNRRKPIKLWQHIIRAHTRTSFPQNCDRNSQPRHSWILSIQIEFHFVIKIAKHTHIVHYIVLECHVKINRKSKSLAEGQVLSADFPFKNLEMAISLMFALHYAIWKRRDNDKRKAKLKVVQAYKTTKWISDNLVIYCEWQRFITTDY